MSEVDDLVKKIICHPLSEPAAKRRADAMGLPLHVTDLCPPGKAFVFDPSHFFNKDGSIRSEGIGQVDGLADHPPEETP